MTTHFGPVSYTDSLGVNTCSGENIYKTAPKGFNKDSETCLMTTAFVAPGTYNYYWCSDSVAPSHSAGLCTANVTETITANGDGTFTDNIVAYY